MNDLHVRVWMVVFAFGGSALAQSPMEPDQGSGTVASNAGVSLDSDSPAAERGEVIGAAPAELRGEAAGDSAVVTASPNARGEGSVVLTRPAPSVAKNSDVPRSSLSW